MKLTYKHTVFTCYIAYISSAVANNLASLLFIIFQDDFGLSTVQLATIVSLNFVVQIVVDLLGAKYIDKVGYRPTAIIASGFLIVGVACLGALPKLLDNTFFAFFLYQKKFLMESKPLHREFRYRLYIQNNANQ